jgi:DNA-binding beta-propeller fold protein YncE
MIKGIGCILIVVLLFGCGGSNSAPATPVSLYVTDIGTNSILVFNNPGTLNGNVAPDRMISGSNTTLNFPKGLWLDSTSNRLYVANAGTNSILVFNNPGTLNGNVAPNPASTISGSNTTLNGPWGLWLDSTSNRLYVANANNSSILVFNNPNAPPGFCPICRPNGNVAPDRKVSGSNTTLNTPVGLWLDTGL